MLFDRFWVKTTILFFILFANLISAYKINAVNTEGIPRIINYDSKDYNGSNKVFQVVQDTNQILFASTTNNVMVFDGNHWQTIPVKGKPCFDVFNGQIYIGAYNDFGRIIFLDKKGYVLRILMVIQGQLMGVRKR